MAIAGKAYPDQDIVNGSAHVGQGGRAAPASYDNTARTVHLPSGDVTTHWLTLEGRFKVDPSGWNA